MPDPLENNMHEAEILHDSHAGALLLTPSGYKTLESELEHLTQVKRPEIADRIRESQQHGEFSEDNSELDEVKFEQAMVENRIAELKAIFGTAQILDLSTIPTDHVTLGSLVTVRDLDFDDEFQVRIVASIEADPEKDLISNESPMGTALIGHEEGEDVSFETPDGKKRYKVLKIGR